MNKAKRVTGISPKQVTTDQLRAYWDGIELTFGADTDHVQGSPFAKKETGKSTSQIERFHSTIKERTKVMKSFRTVDSLIQFMDGFLVWYNFLKPHHSIYGKTPAEAAGIDYEAKTWLDIIKTDKPKISENKKSAISEKPKRISSVKRLGITPKNLFPLGRSKRGRLI